MEWRPAVIELLLVDARCRRVETSLPAAQMLALAGRKKCTWVQQCGAPEPWSSDAGLNGLTGLAARATSMQAWWLCVTANVLVLS